MNYDELNNKIQVFLTEKKLKSTKQRDIIVEGFFKMKKKHATIDELYQIVRKKNPQIGYATVYRTLMLLVEAKVVEQRNFGEGQSQFEIISGEHHDHLICTQCHNITEFENKTIERVQAQVAKEFDFKLMDHKMELYGVCHDCQKKD